MAVVTGTLTDFGLQSLADKSPTVIFKFTGAGTLGSNLFASTPVVVTPAADGTFSVDLQPTDGVVPAGWYTVSIEHLKEGGKYTHFDVLGYKLFVPITGGALGDLPDAPLSPATVLVSLDPPPPGYKGWYLNAAGPGEPPGDPNDPASSGTGILEIVS